MFAHPNDTRPSVIETLSLLHLVPNNRKSANFMALGQIYFYKARFPPHRVELPDSLVDRTGPIFQLKEGNAFLMNIHLLYG